MTMPARGLTVYLPAELEAELLKAAKSKHLSASGLISEAVKQHFKAHPDGVPEGATRQLARLEARIDKLMRDNATLKEALLLFVRIWLEYTPPLAPDEEDDAAALAEQRFERFLDLVRNGGPVV
jgi:hypothetical protein